MPPAVVAISIHNLKQHTEIDENYIKEQFIKSGDTTNWRVNFSSNLKSRAACVVGRESLPNHILKKIDIRKL